ncbi:MAG: NTP transferase domain-containing protein [Methanospirillaceae archaeon]|nr:NTP transferase domain-containing protein [Methanospirillaceae archaeon]
MLAVIMAGGRGTRLGRGEKALVQLDGIPMVKRIVTAFSNAGHTPLVVTTPDTPYTANYCRAHAIEVYQSKGAGYLSDLTETIVTIEETEAFFVAAVDLPCLSCDTISRIETEYRDSGLCACSVWVPVSRYKELGVAIPVPYSEEIDGVMSCPAGINILRGDSIRYEQQELKLVLDEKGLLFHVNTVEMLNLAFFFLSSENPYPDASHLIVNSLKTGKRTYP